MTVKDSSDAAKELKREQFHQDSGDHAYEMAKGEINLKKEHAMHRTHEALAKLGAGKGYGEK